MSFNVKDAGWFYHAPARPKKSDDPVLYPPMSQIPGLACDDGDQADDLPRPLFRDTDTKYIRLAKEGGRRNLLQMRENPTEKRDAVGYPRNDWFYLHDNELEEAEKKKETEEQYSFMRPDYMVHQPYRQEDQGYDRPQRGPLGYDRLTVFERDGNSATDKTVKLPELRKAGYGVRSEKPLKIPKTKQVGKPPSAHTDTGGRGTKPLKYLPMPSAGKSKDRPKINKLLSYAYDREWFEDLADWQAKQDSSREKHKQMMNIPPHLQTEKPVSEYNTSYVRRDGVKTQHTSRDEGALSGRSGGKSAPAPVKQTETQRLREAKLRKHEEKELFKMTRFKNVPARIDTQRHPTQQHNQQQAQAAC